MIIQSKDRSCFAQTNDLKTVFISEGTGRITCKFTEQIRSSLGTYRNYESAMAAVEILLQRIAQSSGVDTTVIQMPTEEEVDKKIKNESQWHHASGKKTKGHGGS